MNGGAIFGFVAKCQPPGGRSTCTFFIQCHAHSLVLHMEGWIVSYALHFVSRPI